MCSKLPAVRPFSIFVDLSKILWSKRTENVILK